MPTVRGCYLKIASKLLFDYEHTLAINKPGYIVKFAPCITKWNIYLCDYCQIVLYKNTKGFK